MDTFDNVWKFFVQTNDDFCLGYIGIFISILILAVNIPLLRCEQN